MEELFIKMVLDAWETQNKRVDDLIGALSDEKLAAQTAPDRNTGAYLLGHLTAVNDGMLPLLGFGEKLHPGLEEPFLKSADRTGHEFPSLETLKKYWLEVNTALRQHIKTMPAAAWFERHNAVSEADFAKEPHRNKLNLVINRTNHQSYHLGQMIYLKH